MYLFVFEVLRSFEIPKTVPLPLSFELEQGANCPVILPLPRRTLPIRPMKLSGKNHVTSMIPVNGPQIILDPICSLEKIHRVTAILSVYGIDPQSFLAHFYVFSGYAYQTGRGNDGKLKTHHNLKLPVKMAEFVCPAALTLGSNGHFQQN